ncbi:MAG: hypothetical protein HFJ11_02790 [Bacilli bacterium]|nr:hypothetical protein [Bacilli bacterium]
MINKYSLILGIVDKIEEWNEKLNAFAGEHMDNVLIGSLVVGVLIFVAFSGINALNKK